MFAIGQDRGGDEPRVHRSTDRSGGVSPGRGAVMAAEHLILEIIEGGKGRAEPPPGDGDGGGPEPIGAPLSDNALALGFSGDVLRDNYLYVAPRESGVDGMIGFGAGKTPSLCQTWPASFVAGIPRGSTTSAWRARSAVSRPLAGSRHWPVRCAGMPRWRIVSTLPRITVDWDTSQADDFRTRGVPWSIK